MPFWSRYQCAVRCALAFAQVFLFLGVCRAGAQEGEQRDHTIVFEVGPASEWSLTGTSFNAGGGVGAEVTPIEHWLELEADLTALGTNGQHSLETDLIFKKPWQLSTRAEFMAGIGPSVSWSLSGGDRRPAFATEILGDFMFWTGKDIGWYAEPSYSLAGFASSNARSFGLSVGLLVGLPFAPR